MSYLEQTLNGVRALGAENTDGHCVWPILSLETNTPYVCATVGKTLFTTRYWCARQEGWVQER